MEKSDLSVSSSPQSERIFVPYQRWFDIGRRTHFVNFKDTLFLTDPTIADACVVVLSSNGSFGSISHLTISDNYIQFALDLRRQLGNDDVRICLSGGLDTIPASMQLANGLISCLNTVGMVASSLPQYSDILGRFRRQATLYRDKVVVMRKLNYDEQPYRPNILRFPSSSKLYN